MSKTYKPKVRKRRRTHGFLTRMKKHGGRAIVKSKRRKNRKRINVA